MRHVRVTLDAGGREAEIHPMYGLLANGDCVDRATALQWNVGIEVEPSFLHYINGDIEAFGARLETVEAVTDYDLEPAGDDAFYAYIKSTPTAPFRATVERLAAGGIVVVPPMVYHADGRLSLSVFGPGEEIQTGLAALPAPLELSVDEVGGLAAVPSTVGTGLSDRQREAIETAFELGYYEIPRQAGHEAVADAMDCAPSTAAEHLRKAESRLLGSVLGNRVQS